MHRNRLIHLDLKSHINQKPAIAHSCVHLWIYGSFFDTTKIILIEYAVITILVSYSLYSLYIWMAPHHMVSNVCTFTFANFCENAYKTFSQWIGCNSNAKMTMRVVKFKRAVCDISMCEYVQVQWQKNEYDVYVYLYIWRSTKCCFYKNLLT